MKMWVVTPAYLDAPLLAASLEAFRSTTWQNPAYHEHILLDHHWPIGYWRHRHDILNLAEAHRCRVMSCYKNLGGHGGFNWVLKNIPIEDEDLVMTFDADSFPITQGWDRAMLEAMQGDPNLASLSLFIDADLNTKHWEDIPTAGLRPHRVVQPKGGHPEMINVTCWRYSFLKRTSMLRAGGAFYGGVEQPMHLQRKKFGMTGGYLADFHEVMKPFEPDSRYQTWKRDHIQGYPKNFDEWLIEHGHEATGPK